MFHTKQNVRIDQIEVILNEIIFQKSDEDKSVIETHLESMVIPPDSEYNQFWREATKISINLITNSHLVQNQKMQLNNQLDSLYKRIKGEQEYKKKCVESHRLTEPEEVKETLLKIEKAYILSFKNIMEDIHKEFNPENGSDKKRTFMDFFIKTDKYDDFNNKFNKFEKWYKSGNYIKRFMGEVEKNFETIKD